METTIRPCVESDLDELQRIAYETYDETFRSLNTARTMAAYLSTAFDPARLLSEMRAAGSTFFFLRQNSILAGYLKLNVVPDQTDLNDPDSMEIERFYLRAEFKGRGLGRLLMEFALRKTKAMGRNYAWLSVWEKNTTALEFYRKSGFTVFGRHGFQMGDEVQSDLLLRTPAESGGPQQTPRGPAGP